ncbi:hypothetical protein CBM2589_B180132 [Cupriavidus taiwanensis]|uniref:Uncharacterized protein n=1 Tax=Cupriavidus taiwanensis TaxID=164546 RepID=A0A975WWY8_9BURK|nr:hypothetical protein CBM2589_B180132 [Cupriavidus taiwanensis]
MQVHSLHCSTGHNRGPCGRTSLTHWGIAASAPAAVAFWAFFNLEDCPNAINCHFWRLAAFG